MRCLAIALALAVAAPCQAAPQVPGWEALPTEPFRGKQDDIVFASPAVGWYGNGAGRIFRTGDGGSHWTEIWSSPGTFVRALAAIDERTVIAGNIGPGYFPNVSDVNPLYRSTNGGASWVPVTRIDGPMPVGICALDVFSERRGSRVRRIVHAGGRVGGPAVLLRSDDDGISWSSRDMTDQTAMILDVKFVTAKVGFIAGASDADVKKARPVILRTDDGGRSWRPVFTGTRPYEITWKIAFPTRRIGYVTIQSYDPDPAKSQRFVAKTEDGGRSWRELPVVDRHDWRAFGIGFVDALHGWIGGTTGGFETKDGGFSWQPADLGRAVNKIRVVPDGRSTAVYAIGSEVRRLTLARQGNTVP